MEPFRPFDRGKLSKKSNKDSVLGSARNSLDKRLKQSNSSSRYNLRSSSHHSDPIDDFPPLKQQQKSTKPPYDNHSSESTTTEKSLTDVGTGVMEAGIGCDFAMARDGSVMPTSGSEHADSGSVSIKGNKPSPEPNLQPTEPYEIPQSRVHGHEQHPSSPKMQSARTYASIFKDASNITKQGKLRFIAPLVTQTGTKRAVIPDYLLAKQVESWSTTLVGYFIGKRPAFPFVKFHANRLWKKFELDDVILNDKGYFYFKFNNEQGLMHVLENGPWLFNDVPILLQKWEPGMWFDKPKPTKVSLWVNIYDLPADLWNYEILSRIVSVVGVPIAVDRYTTEMCEKKTGRAVFARVLVEIGSDEEVPMFVDVNILDTIRRFRLQYNWISPRCSHCKIFGHLFNDCSVRPRPVDEMEDRMDNAAKPDEVDPLGAKDDDFQQPRRRRRTKQHRPTTDNVVLDTQSVDKPVDPANLSEVPANPADLREEVHSVPKAPTLVKENDIVTSLEQQKVDQESSVVTPSTPRAMEDLSKLNLATDFSLETAAPDTQSVPVVVPVVDADTVLPDPQSSSSRHKAESDSDNIWSYRDPTGKIQGPFSIIQLHKWSEQGCFPKDFKIWSISSTEKESMLIYHVLKRRAIVNSATIGSDNQKTARSLKNSDGG